MPETLLCRAISTFAGVSSILLRARISPWVRVANIREIFMCYNEISPPNET